MTKTPKSGPELVQINQKHPRELIRKMRRLAHAEETTLSAKVRDLLQVEVDRHERETRVEL